MTNERRINLRFTPEHFEQLNEKRFRSRLAFQQLGMKLFDDWLASDGNVALYSSIRKPADPLLEKLATLQAHGDKRLLAVPRKAIEITYTVLQQCITAEELKHLKAVAYGEAKPRPKPPTDAPPKRRGRPRKAQ